jgi:hypothetical protein
MMPGYRHHSSARCVVLLALLLQLSLGCQHSESLRADASGRFALPRMIRTLRENSGGLEAWKKYTGVRFAYAVEFGGSQGRVVFPEVAFRLDDYRHIWVRREGDPHPVRRILGEVPRVHGSLALGFALSSVPYFFCLPLTAERGWEFRGLIAPAGVVVAAEFEMIPRDPTAPIGACLIPAGPEGNPLGKIVYRGKHPFLAGRPHLLEFQGYRKVCGVEVAKVRTHVNLAAKGFDPFAQEPSSPVWILRETLTKVTFLSQQEADQRYPVVELGAEAP